jgi:hypothetical protein
MCTLYIINILETTTISNMQHSLFLSLSSPWLQVGSLDVNVLCPWVEHQCQSLHQQYGTLVVTFDDGQEQGIEAKRTE